MTKLFSKIIFKAFSISFLFFFSSIGAPVLIGSASGSPSSLAALASTPLSSLEANWAEPNGNAFNTNYNPQNQINSSNAQYLGLSWLFPLPTHPTALLNVGGGLGVDAAPLIINGTVYFVTQFAQVVALNAANGNVLWTDVLPVTPNSTQGHKGVGAVSLHMHDGAEQFTTKLFGGDMVTDVVQSSATTLPAIKVASKIGSGAISSLGTIATSAAADTGFDCTQGNGLCRWGDYAAATPDPAAPTTGAASKASQSASSFRTAAV